MFASPCPFCQQSLLGQAIEQQGELPDAPPGTHLYAVAVICKCGKRHGDFVIGVDSDANSMQSWRNKVAYYQGKTHLAEEDLKPCPKLS